MPPRLRFESLSIEHSAKVEMRMRKLGLQLNGANEVPAGTQEFAPAGQEVSEIVVNVRIGRIERERETVFAEGEAVLPRLIKHHSEVVVMHGGAWLGIHCRTQMPNGRTELSAVREAASLDRMERGQSMDQFGMPEESPCVAEFQVTQCAGRAGGCFRGMTGIAARTDRIEPIALKLMVPNHRAVHGKEGQTNRQPDKHAARARDAAADLELEVVEFDVI